MNISALILQFTFALVAYVSCTKVDVNKEKRQVGHAADEDREVAETGFGSAALGTGKYFQDFFSLKPAPDKLEFGHVCESPEDWEQRYEKKDFQANKHQGKVRWGDKHGGYGEHYWDYNHAGHDGHDGEETQEEPQYVEYTPENVPTPSKYVTGRAKRQPVAAAARDVEYISGTARLLAESGITGRHGGNYRRAPENERAKRQDGKVEIRDLVYDVPSEMIVDQKTGQVYKLVPV